jgi:hypothetical protein
MAFIVPTKRGTFEVRESRNTPEGPRSRTLASFSELTDEVIEKARKRATGPVPSAEDLRAAAIRAGAPVPGSDVDEAARAALRLLAQGRQLDPMLKRLLLDALRRDDRSDRPGDPGALVSDAARSVTEWIGVDPKQRGEVLRDLLEFADAVPIRLRPKEIGFPRLRSV